MADISKIKTPDGITYNIKDENTFHTPAVIMSTNPFAEPANEHGSSALFMPKIDNAFYCADKRFDVSVSGEYSTFVGKSYLFDGNYDGEILKIENDKTATITIDFSNLSGSKFPGYPYGFIYISFYYVCKPKTITGRVYNNYSSQGVGWKNITFQNCFSNVYRAENTYYGLQTIEITITGDGSNSYGHTSVSEIDMHLTRPSPNIAPFLGKYSAETLYYPLTAPSFIGSGASLTNLNGSNISSGTVNAQRLPNATTSSKGITQLNDTVTSNSTTQAATANAVKQVNDLTNSIESAITSIQTSTLAVKAYNVNDLFWYNGKLYKATTAIAQNGNIVIGTNCTETKLADILVKNTDIIPVSQGGTGETSFTANSIIVGNGTDPLESTILGIDPSGTSVTLKPTSNNISLYVQPTGSGSVGINTTAGNGVIRLNAGSYLDLWSKNAILISNQTASTPYNLNIKSRGQISLFSNENNIKIQSGKNNNTITLVGSVQGTRMVYDPDEDTYTTVTDIVEQNPLVISPLEKTITGGYSFDGNAISATSLDAETGKFKKLNIPTASNETTYGLGTNGQIIKSNGSSVYWATADSTISAGSTSTNVTTSKAVADFVEGKGYAFNNEITSVQTSAIASKAYAVNDILIYNNQLYKVTTAISSGGVITPSSNCIAITLDDVMIKNSDLATTTTNGIMSAEDKEKLDNQNKAIYKIIENQKVATFDDGIQNSTLKNYSIKIEPRQDLHEYGRPWAGGTNNNLLPMATAENVQNTSSSMTFSFTEDGYITINGTSGGSTSYIVVPFEKKLPAAQYTVALFNPSVTTSSGVQFSTRGANRELVGMWCTTNTTNKTYTENVSGDTYYWQLQIQPSMTFNNFKIAPMLVSGSTAPVTYTPYSNVCPITGYDNINIIRTGKNLFFQTIFGYYPADTGVISAGNWQTDIAYVQKGKVYTINPDTSIPTGGVWAFYMNKPQPGSTSYNSSRTVTYVQKSFTAPITGYVAVRRINGESGAMLIEGQTMPPIESYNSQQISIPINSLTNSTIYGGTLAVNEDGSGTLVVDRATMAFNGSENWFAGSLNRYGINISDALPSSSSGDDYPQFVTDNTIYFSTNPNPYCALINDQKNLVAYAPSDINTLDKWKAFVQANPFTLCYYINTPQTYSLTASQLTVLLGINHILSDAGNITITYPTNLKGYIDSVNNNINTLFGNNQSDAIADKAYAIGDLFMYNNRLYKATSAISLGGTILPETNCTQTTLIDVLTNIN